MKAIKIEKLFGRFDYEIDLAEDGMTILTGPNGFGKSTILQCINAAANSNLEYFFSLDFERFEVLMQEPEDHLVIVKKQNSLCINGDMLSKQDFLLWKRGSRGRVLFSKENHLVEKSLDTGLENVSHSIKLMKSKIGDVFTIEEQRLLTAEKRSIIRSSEVRREVEEHIVQVVETIPRKLRILISKVASEYSRVANELDSTFPQRLFNEKNGISEDEFDEKLESMQRKVEKLSKYDISNIGKLEDIQFRKEDARALKVYFEDFEEKYRQYEALINKLEMFTEMVNDRLLFKKVCIFEDTLQVVDNDNPEKKLALSQLSSGEKETVVLFYQLLFEVPDGVILLIDEPEISLHIAWQRKLAEDLKKIVEQKRLTAIIATHSPQFINGNRRIQIDLGKLYKDGLSQR